MGFFLGLIGYLTAVALMLGGAFFSALWVTRPMPPPREVVVTDPARHMQGANVALTKRHGSKHHVTHSQHVSKRH